MVKSFRFLKRHLKTASNHNQIVSELLVLAKPQSYDYKPFFLSDVIGYVVNLIGHEATLNNVYISVENAVPQACIFGDKNQIIQVFINIIKNSIEAMPDGGTIHLRVWKEEQTIHVTISDTGVGISKERLQKIGEPFFTLNEKGMGLGLTTSTKIMQEHKGTLDIESEVGKGTTVHLTFWACQKNDRAASVIFFIFAAQSRRFNIFFEKSLSETK